MYARFWSAHTEVVPTAGTSGPYGPNNGLFSLARGLGDLQTHYLLHLDN